MTNEELDREFNLMYNNITSNKAPGLNKYEKSLILTEAQEMLVVGLYNGTSTGNMTFEETEEITSYLSTLVGQKSIESCEDDNGLIKATDKSYVFKLPDEVMFVTYEDCYIKDSSFCDTGNERNVFVIPVTQDELKRTLNNPFKGPNKNKVLRLSYSVNKEEQIQGSTTSEKKKIRYSEIVSKYNVNKYVVRYLKKPSPIILENLSYGLTIDGKSNKSECSLPDFLHRKLLLNAVSIAKSFWS